MKQFDLRRIEPPVPLFAWTVRGAALDKSFNKAPRPTDEHNVTVHRAAPDSGQPPPPSRIDPGTILVGTSGQVRIVRSRTADGTGWNCADGAAIAHEVAIDQSMWAAYTPEQLAAALAVAEDVRHLSGQRELAGGLATWDACSGRPCVLPKLAKVVSRLDRSPMPDWLSTLD